MLTLGIETSCDETGVALVRDGRLLGQKLASQVDVHALFGGVVPEIASREHQKLLPGLLHALLQETGAELEDVDGIAVARGPGLLGALLVGVSFAKGLSLSTGAPLVGVNHLWAHLLAPGLEDELLFPALGLLVSGGHTHIYHVASPTQFTLLGRTLDDAAGEAFDKVAKQLNFPYPGGRYIDELACGTPPDARMLPVPYVDNDNLDFSFSGLKTAVANYVARHPQLAFEHMVGAEVLEREADPGLRLLCASFNHTVAETLRIKVERALDRTEDVRSLIVAGGVAANSELRRVMSGVGRSRQLHVTLPALRLCTDNGAMIAHAGQQLLQAGLRHDLSLEAVPRGRTVPLDWC